ncbi:hypothetical protein LSM04_003870 [Trypanosoma melophagium]|uniref:uncharacterized protein n=1 Tax=Trypanosoma melophagium TaxID=715481 RepID=UPI00351A08B3|nr:hypothetical protein LSM04_003870 [Trypanosoma melophagium]
MQKYRKAIQNAVSRTHRPLTRKTNFGNPDTTSFAAKRAQRIAFPKAQARGWVLIFFSFWGCPFRNRLAILGGVAPEGFSPRQTRKADADAGAAERERSNNEEKRKKNGGNLGTGGGRTAAFLFPFLVCLWGGVCFHRFALGSVLLPWAFASATLGKIPERLRCVKRRVDLGAASHRIFFFLRSRLYSVNFGFFCM